VTGVRRTSGVVLGCTLACALAIALGSAGSVAAAEPTAEQVKEARAHYERGKALYTLGQYAEAIREFSAGYLAAPRPQFLLNLGQCHRKLGELGRAREMYQKFLDEAPGAPERAQVTALIADLDREIAAERVERERIERERAERERAERERAERERAGRAATATNPPPTPSSRPSSIADSSGGAAAGRSAPKRRWWILGVVLGGAAVAGAAIGVGVWAGTRAPDGPRCGDPNVLGCIDASAQALSLSF
jgi:tetratricopeptide (TPR) repeat protein